MFRFSLSSPAGTRWTLFSLFIFFLLLSLSASSLHDQFLADDYAWLRKARLNIEAGRWLAPFVDTGGSNFYRPITALSYQLDLALFGYQPLGYHLHQLLVRLLLVIGVAWMLWELFQNEALAFAAALVFAVYPSQHEVVTWLAGRGDLYAALFTVLAVGSLVRFLRQARYRWYGLSLLFTAFAFLSKESAFVLPALLVAACCVAVPLRPWRRFFRHWVFILPSVGILAAVLLVRERVLSDAIGGYLVGGESLGLHVTWASLTKPFTAILYLVNWGYARAVAGDHGLIQQLWVFWQKILLHPKLFALLAVLAIVAALWWLKDPGRRKFLLFGVAWALIAFVPVLGLSANLNASLVGSRFFFLSSIGYAMVFALILWPSSRAPSLLRRSRQVASAGAVIVFALLWRLNAVPWRLAADQVTTIKTAFASQQSELLADRPTHLVVGPLPAQVFGAYSFYGRESFREAVHELTRNPALETHTLGRVPDADSPFCDDSTSARVAVIEWDQVLKRFSRTREAALEKMRRLRDAAMLRWDFTDAQTTQTWSFHDLRVTQRSDGVEIVVPETGASIESPPLNGLFAGAYRSAEFRFRILDQDERFGRRRLTLDWSRGNAFPQGNRIKFSYGAGDELVVNVPLCQYLNWMLADGIERLRLLPTQTGTIILQSFTLNP